MVAAGLLCLSCSTPQDRLSPAEFVRENSNLLQQLGSYVESEQRQGISRVKKLGREQGSAVALYLLQDPKLDEYRVEVVLARILADWRQPSAIPFLLQSLSAPDDGAVRIASEGLLAFGDSEPVLQALEEMLQRPVVRDRRTAAEILKRLSNPRVTEVILARWAGETDRDVRGAYLVRLIQTKHPRRRELLVTALTDPDLGIRSLAWETLRKYPDLPRINFDPDGSLEERARDVAVLRLWIAPGK